MAVKLLQYDNTPTSVKGIERVQTNSANAVYDLQGRPIDSSKLKKGIYIVNGKKLIVE